MLASAVPTSAPMNGCGWFSLALALLWSLSFALAFVLAFAFALVGLLQWALRRISNKSILYLPRRPAPPQFARAPPPLELCLPYSPS